MTIRALDPLSDLAAVTAFYQESPDYWLLADGKAPDAQKAADFFSDGPPGCDPAASHRLGFFLNGRLSGLAELSFGFPSPGDAYLGLMQLGNWARGAGHGRAFLGHVESLARKASCRHIYLGVLEANPRGRAFWRREGFTDTGLSRADDAAGLNHVVHRMVKKL